MIRRENSYLQETVVLGPYPHAQATADTTEKVWSPSRQFKIDRVQYINPTGLAEDATDFFVIKVLNEALVAASWSTKTGEEGTIDADTFVDLTLSDTAANLVLEAGDVLSISLDEDAGATATLPAGRFVIEGRYLQ